MQASVENHSAWPFYNHIPVRNWANLNLPRIICVAIACNVRHLNHNNSGLFCTPSETLSCCSCGMQYYAMHDVVTAIPIYGLIQHA